MLLSIGKTDSHDDDDDDDDDDDAGGDDDDDNDRRCFSVITEYSNLGDNS